MTNWIHKIPKFIDIRSDLLELFDK